MNNAFKDLLSTMSHAAIRSIATPLLADRSIFRWNDLPGEIKNKIFGYALTQDHVIRPCIHRQSRLTGEWCLSHYLGEEEVNTMAPSLLLANKQINRQGTPILYRTNKFHFMSHCNFIVFVSQLRTATLQFVERISMEDYCEKYLWNYAFDMSTVADDLQGALMKRVFLVTASPKAWLRYRMRENMPRLMEWLVWLEDGKFERRVVIKRLLRSGISSREQLEMMKDEFLGELTEKL